jgi:hypothetical protein
MWVALIALGFPTSLALFAIDSMVHSVLPSNLSDVLYPIGFLGLAYLQAFIILPRVFQRRAASGKKQAGDGEEVQAR